MPDSAIQTGKFTLDDGPRAKRKKVERESLSKQFNVQVLQKLNSPKAIMAANLKHNYLKRKQRGGMNA